MNLEKMEGQIIPERRRANVHVERKEEGPRSLWDQVHAGTSGPVQIIFLGRMRSDVLSHQPPHISPHKFHTSPP